MTSLSLREGNKHKSDVYGSPLKKRKILCLWRGILSGFVQDAKKKKIKQGRQYRVRRGWSSGSYIKINNKQEVSYKNNERGAIYKFYFSWGVLLGERRRGGNKRKRYSGEMRVICQSAFHKTNEAIWPTSKQKLIRAIKSGVLKVSYTKFSEPWRVPGCSWRRRKVGNTTVQCPIWRHLRFWHGFCLVTFYRGCSLISREERRPQAKKHGPRAVVSTSTSAVLIWKIPVYKIVPQSVVSLCSSISTIMVPNLAFALLSILGQERQLTVFPSRDRNLRTTLPEGKYLLSNLGGEMLLDFGTWFWNKARLK